MSTSTCLFLVFVCLAAGAAFAARMQFAVDSPEAPPPSVEDDR